MQLLGLYIMGEQKGIAKVLRKGCYLFGDYKKPALGKTVKVIYDEGHLAASSVNQRKKLPEISVNCIVGMNGAGKS